MASGAELAVGPECRERDREVFNDGPQLRDLNTINANEPTWEFHSVPGVHPNSRPLSR